MVGQANSTDSSESKTTLTVMSLVDEKNAEFENKILSQSGFQIRYIPAFESDNDRLSIYRELFHEHSPQPDICEIDIIWPALIADDLVDLRPYLGEDIKAFAPDLIEAFTVRGRLVAIPLFVDTGLLYYRSDLLRKYGFRSPPRTWDELGMMAKVIQAGERRKGHTDFWGFVWQGGAAEALTCNALEWQDSEGGGTIVEPNKTITVCNPRAVHALERAVSWVGAISPAGVVTYDEDDAFNIWQSGNAAFMRSWTYLYGSVHHSTCPVHDRFGVAMLPGGKLGQRRALGGIAIAISKYSNRRTESVAAIRRLTSEAAQMERVHEAGSVPTRWSLQQRPDLMENTPFHGLLSGRAMTGIVARPSLAAGPAYDRVSSAYFNAVHSALTHQLTAEQALERLEAELVRITGFRAVRD